MNRKTTTAGVKASTRVWNSTCPALVKVSLYVAKPYRSCCIRLEKCLPLRFASLLPHSSLKESQSKLTDRSSLYGKASHHTNCFGRKSPDSSSSEENAETRRHKSNLRGSPPFPHPSPSYPLLWPFALPFSPLPKSHWLSLLEDHMDDDMSPRFGLLACFCRLGRRVGGGG